MSGLEGSERIHQARVAIYPVRDSGQATWSFTTVRYDQGGRVPRIITEQSGYILCPDRPSEWALAEALYDVLRREVLARRH